MISQKRPNIIHVSRFALTQELSPIYRQFPRGLGFQTFGGGPYEKFHTVGEQRDGCMIGTVFEPNKEIPDQRCGSLFHAPSLTMGLVLTQNSSRKFRVV